MRFLALTEAPLRRNVIQGMSEHPDSPPELPHEGPPYQGYGPAPYQPPAPAPPPAPLGWQQPMQQAAPSEPPPSYTQPVPEPAAARRPVDPSDGEVLQKWGYVMAFSTLIMPILGLAGMTLGAILATKPHRQRHGLIIIGISLALGVVAVVIWAIASDG
jgi:hypothetical protein